MAESYFLDANIFINPYRLYYPFDLAPHFWNQMEKAIIQENVAVMDVVYKEIIKSEDELAGWIKGIEGLKQLSRKDEAIIAQYRKVLAYVQKCGLYTSEAFRTWAMGETADPWLIAAAAASQDAVIITMESGSGPISVKNPSKNAKIPNVAQKFGIRCENLFYFMRMMKIQL